MALFQKRQCVCKERFVPHAEGDLLQVERVDILAIHHGDHFVRRAVSLGIEVKNLFRDSVSNSPEIDLRALIETV
jgi:hypothetical protein